MMKEGEGTLRWADCTIARVRKSGWETISDRTENRAGRLESECRCGRRSDPSWLLNWTAGREGEGEAASCVGGDVGRSKHAVLLACINENLHALVEEAL